MALRIIVSTFTASRGNDQKIQVQMKESRLDQWFNTPTDRVKLLYKMYSKEIYMYLM